MTFSRSGQTRILDSLPFVASRRRKRLLWSLSFSALCSLAGLLASPIAASCANAADRTTATGERTSLNEQQSWRVVAFADTSEDSTTPKSSAAPGKRVAPKQRIAGKTEGEESDEMGENPFNRIKAPSLDGGVEWINTAAPLDLKELRGKLVILDFWTYCCINCMHILPVLKKIEHAYPNDVVVIGVHSAKFAQEQDGKSITEAVLRYEIEHPVVNDAQHALWRKFDVQSWPSLRVIDPEGYVIAAHSGEIDFDTIDKFIKKALAYYRRQKLMNETPLRFDLAAYKTPRTPLRFPGKLLADEAGRRLFIADSNHNRIVVAELDGKLQDVIGGGAEGAVDGDYVQATFNHPQGMALHGNLLYVADTENHMLRKIDLQKKHVVTIAGTGKQGDGWPGLDRINANRGLPRHYFGKPRTTALNSPWALSIQKNSLYIAMAGPHQIWRMPLTEEDIGPYAGNSREDIVDGPLLPHEPRDPEFASFAQPSGLTSDGKTLFVADSEGSSIRAVPLDPRGEVRTVIGTAVLPRGRLFTFGDVDGPQGKALLQHPLDVAFGAGAIFVADTYNSKIKVVRPQEQTVETISGGNEPGDSDDPPRFREPAGLSYAAGKLYVADTNNHLIRVIDLEHESRVSTLTIEGLAPPEIKPAAPHPAFAGAEQFKVPAASVQPVDGTVRFRVSLKLPRGFKINQEAPMRYMLEAVSEDGRPIDSAGLGKLIDPPHRDREFDVLAPVRPAAKEPVGQEVFKLSLLYNYCQDGPNGVCKAASVVWQVPLTVSADATATTVKLEHQAN
jgi:thiol-disulfide isomerase/thioredoxin